MLNIKDEFYCSKEYNRTTEYQHFPAEIYIKPKEENTSGKEHADLGKEITTLQKSKKVEKKSNKDKQGLVDKIFNSLKGVAITSSVAVVAIVGTTTLISTPPKVELLDLTCGTNYVEYEISIDEIKPDAQYSILISTTNEKSIEFPVENDGTYKNKVEGLKPKWEYSLSFISVDEYLGNVTYFEKKFQTSSTNPLPNVAVKNVSYANLNEIKIDFDNSNLDENNFVEMHLYYEDSNDASVFTLTNFDIKKGYFVAFVDGYNHSNVTIKPVINFHDNEKVIECTPYQFLFTTEIDLDITVNKVNNNILFNIKAITGESPFVKIIDADTLEELLFEELYYNPVVLPYTQDSKKTYTIYICDEFGEKRSDEFTTTIDTSLNLESEYTYYFINPGDFAITYNDDFTINAYAITGFNCEDERIYYQISIGDMKFRSKQNIFCAEGLIADSFAIKHEICFDANGIQYTINETIPSGAINEFNIDTCIYLSIEENTANVSFYDYNFDIVQIDTVVFTSSSGEEFRITEEDLVYNQNNYSYDVQLTFTKEFEYIEITAVATPYKDLLTDIANYIGSASSEFYSIIYK